MMRYGQKWLGKHRKIGFTYCAQCCPVFILSKNSVKIWPKKKLLRHRRYAALRRGSKSHFSQKNAFFGQKMAFFWKIHFIQNSLVTKYTSRGPCQAKGLAWPSACRRQRAYGHFFLFVILLSKTVLISYKQEHGIKLEMRLFCIPASYMLW